MQGIWGIAVLALAATGLAASAGNDRPLVAVFDVQDTRKGKSKLSATQRKGLADHLASKLGVGGKFKVVPRARVLSAIRSKKKETHKDCYDQSCQIDVGKQLAAQKSLASKVTRLDAECVVTCTLYDLKQGAAENSASYRGPCGRSELLTAMEQIAAKLRGDKTALAAKRIKDEAAMYESACDSGDVQACYDAARNWDKANRRAEAVPLYRKACNGGHIKGCGVLGTFYYEGYGGLAKSKEKAAPFIIKACNGGLAGSCNDLGHMHEYGLGGVEKSHNEAMRVYRKACDAGWQSSCNRIERIDK